jgi:hypothetical protein
MRAPGMIFLDIVLSEFSYGEASVWIQIVNSRLKAYSFCSLLLTINVFFFPLNLGWKSYRFYLWLFFIKFVFLSIFAGVATDMQMDKLCSDIPICSLIYRLIFLQLTLHSYEVFWFIYIHSALHIRWCWCWEILASFLLWLLDLGNFIGIANCSYECYSYVTYSLFLFIYCPEMQF